MNKDWHSLNIEEVYEKLNSSKDGLSSKEVEERQVKYGKNVLPKAKEPTLAEIILNQFISPLIIILIIAGIICIFIGEHLDSFFIFIVLIVNAILGAYQEYSAVKSASSIQKLLKIKAEVLRDGRKSEIDSEDLVPGDIILLESGDKVPADTRLISAHNLQLDEAFLTGESEGVQKRISAVRADASIAERFNICYASSTVQSGRGTAIVVETGINTEIGTIAESLSEAKEAKSPLTIRMEKFTKQIMYIVFVFALLAAWIMITKGYEQNEVFLLVVAMCVSAIPESLPIAQTVVLSLATSRMSKKNVIVKKLSAVESLGSCTVIASDKTGTLTVNQQTAKIMALPDGSNFEITGEGYSNEGEIKIDDDCEHHSEQAEFICKMGAINNEAVLYKKDGEFLHHGDSIDLAFLSLGLKTGITEETLSGEFNIFGRISYESENKYSAVFYQRKGKDCVTVKGSAETILEMCSYQRMDNDVIPLDYEKQRKEYLRLAAEGYRVIALATGEYFGDKKENYTVEDIKDLNFIGYIGFIDPIRSTSKAAIERCHQAGIRVLMITGDHPLTAKAISKELNLIADDGWVVTGKEVEEAYNESEQKLIKLITEYDVFARVSPQQKAIIVDTLKDQGEFIAVTGDGINDAPALKKANIGVAMGSGTDVAKDVSPMIITDDNFLSIVSAVEEGRFAYNNFRKVVYLLISTAFAEMLLFTLTVAFGLPMPFTTVQILWINLVTNGIQDIAIACEKGEKGVMKDKPRKANERIFNGLMLKETVLSALTMFTIVILLWSFLTEGGTLTGDALIEPRNYLLLVMVLLQNFHAFNCRSEKTSAFKVPLKNNPFIAYAVLGALTLHLIFMNIPFLQGILKTSPVSLQQFFFAILMAMPLLFVMEVFKFINKKFKRS